MISQQSEKVKKTMLCNKNLEELLNTPLDEKRENWEKLASSAIIPDDIIIKKAVINNTSIEWISTDKSNMGNVIVYFHGGGFCQGSINTHRRLAAHIVKSTDLTVLIFDYPLAPESPYPDALNCSKGIYEYLLNNDTIENIIFAGDSAGGGLALALTLLLKHLNIPLPKGIFLFSPFLDLTLSGDTIKTCAQKDPICFKDDLKMDADYYVGTESHYNPFISPIYGDITGFPPLLIQVGSDEILYSDSTRFANKARESQVNIRLSVWEGMWHVFQAWIDDIPEAADALKEVSWFIKNVLK